MTSSHTKFGLTGALLVGIVLVVVASVLVDLFLPTRIWGNVPFHSTGETLSGVSFALSFVLSGMRMGCRRRWIP